MNIHSTSRDKAVEFSSKKHRDRIRIETEDYMITHFYSFYNN